MEGLRDTREQRLKEPSIPYTPNVDCLLTHWPATINLCCTYFHTSTINETLKPLLVLGIMFLWASPFAENIS